MASRNINLHPQGHHPSTLGTPTFDVLIIGGGPSANIAEARLANAGLSIAVIQHELYGGECHFFGCIPSKALLRPIEAFEAAKAVGGAREAIVEDKVDVDAVFKRRDGIVDEWDDGKWIAVSNKPTGAALIRGYARIAGEKRVSVQAYGETERYILEARHAVVVATGSIHVVPGIPGIEELEPGKELWINRDAVAANVVPEHLVILGAGPVGCEMATFYSAVGSEVTLVTPTAEILPKVERQAAAIVRKSLEKKGVKVKLDTRATKIEKHATNSLTMGLSNGETVTASVVLNATGRRPTTYDFGLESIGLTGEGKPLETNGSLAVQVPGSSESWLYGIGDVNGLSPTTHMGIYQARIASNAIISSIRDRIHSMQIKIPIGVDITIARRSENTFPQVIFTEPNISAVGHTLASAQAAGLNVRAVDSDFSIPGAWLYGDGQPGWARWVVEEETNKLVGATFCCVEGSEFVNASQVAIFKEMTLDEMVHVVPPFPTRGEIWTYLLNAAGY